MIQETINLMHYNIIFVVNFLHSCLFFIFKKPEYFALLVSVISVIVSVRIAKENREAVLRKEIYFKKQEMTEKIVSDCLEIANQIDKLDSAIIGLFEANKINGNFIDTNDTYAIEYFNKSSKTTSTLIEIYFKKEVGDLYNEVTTEVGKLLTLLKSAELRHEKKQLLESNFLLDFKIALDQAYVKSKQIADFIKDDLKKYESKLSS